jgi:hypothetical protein
MYHQGLHSTILRSAHTVYLCVVCGSDNSYFFSYTPLTDWFYNLDGVFTARYEIDIYTLLRWFHASECWWWEKTNPTLHTEIMAIRTGQLVCNCKWQGALARLVSNSHPSADASGLAARSQRPALATVQKQINACCECYGTDSCGSSWSSDCCSENWCTQ